MALLWYVALFYLLGWEATQVEMETPKLASVNLLSPWVYPLRLPRAAGTPSKMTASQKSTVVRLHNTYRSSVNPSAADMEYMEWDEELASLAQEWANKCVFRHGYPPHSLGSLGQNLYWGPNSVELAMKLWHGEYKDYHYDSNKCSPGKVCGHYTQVVWSKSNRVGCGIQQCPRYHFVVCNYRPAGNYVGQKPYQKGKPCSRCKTGSGSCWKNTCVSESQCNRHQLNCIKNQGK